MSKKTAQVKVVYQTPPFIIFLIVVLCVTCLYVVLVQNFIIEQITLSERIQILQRVHQVIPGSAIVPSSMNIGKMSK